MWGHCAFRPLRRLFDLLYLDGLAFAITISIMPQLTNHQSFHCWSISFFQFLLNSKVVTGRLVKPSDRGWLVQPYDRRRKQENIEDELILNVVDVDKGKGARVSKKSNGNNGNGGQSKILSQNSNNSHSDGSNSFENEAAVASGRSRKSTGKGSSSSSEEGRAANHANTRSKKRKSDVTDDSDRPKQQSRKTVTFKEGNYGRQSSSTSKSPDNTDTKNNNNNGGKAKRATRIGTRSSTRNSGEIELFPLSLPVKKGNNNNSKSKKKKVYKGKKIDGDENVTVVKMLTGTLYLYRGERPRAEFVRFKWLLLVF